ncbi:MAG: hypothetical protein OEW75_17895, partial [Cyclobacteriaceae bacterium]|nr:hypothetical protein [Cyclobacteriaceae bacterium]
EWKTHLESYSNEYKKFEFASLQFSNTDNKVYSNLIVYHNPDYVDIFARKRKLDPDIGVQLKANAVTRPKVVRNHQTQAREIIIQNDSNEVSLIGANGKILWSKKLKGKVISEIQQIDYFRNGYLQYIMAYDSAVTVIDRNGNEVSGFPRKLPFKVDKFNVIDYDNSKNYRFIFSDIHGNVFMYNKEGSLLEGWRPFFSNGTLAIEPRHIRVRGRDCIILFQKSGKFFLLSRRAEVLPGFPVDLGPDVNFDYALSYGSNFSNSEFTFVNKQGLIKRMNLEGEILNQQQFLSEFRNPQFTIVSDVLGRGYIIVAREIGNIQFMNEKGETLFQQRLVGGLNYNFQYYNFGSTQKLYVITDPEQEYSYLFNSSGNLLNNSPIDSKFDIGVLYSESNNQYKIYSAYENKVNIYSF